MIKKRIATFILAGIVGLTALGGTTITSHAANTTDIAYSFSNSNASGTTSWRRKENNSNVYVYPTAGPTLYYTVQGKRGTNGAVVNCSNRVMIPVGVQASITNSVREHGNDNARLRYDRITVANVLTSGEWSPDSTRNYTIYN